jgi:hypothetical protein
MIGRARRASYVSPMVVRSTVRPPASSAPAPPGSCATPSPTGARPVSARASGYRPLGHPVIRRDAARAGSSVSPTAAAGIAPDPVATTTAAAPRPVSTSSPTVEPVGSRIRRPVARRSTPIRARRVRSTAQGRFLVLRAASRRGSPPVQPGSPVSIRWCSTACWSNRGIAPVDVMPPTAARADGDVPPTSAAGGGAGPRRSTTRASSALGSRRAAMDPRPSRPQRRRRRPGARPPRPGRTTVFTAPPGSPRSSMPCSGSAGCGVAAGDAPRFAANAAPRQRSLS